MFRTERSLGLHRCDCELGSMTYLVPLPWTRINDEWIDIDIPCDPITEPRYHSLIQGDSRDWTQRFQPTFYRNFAVDIVSETAYNYPYPYVSEKTLRPIACKRLFIIIGPAHMLALLRRKGFATFADYIDESYDGIEDPNQRFRCVQNAIADFVTRPLEDLRATVTACVPRLELNFRCLQQLEQTEIKQLSMT